MRALALFVNAVFLLLAAQCTAQQKPQDVASSFLPPGTKMQAIERFDPESGKLKESSLAVFSGHFVSATSDDIVFAYANTSAEADARSLFVSVLRKVAGKYVVVFQKSYYGRFLWVQDFTTVGLRILRLPGDSIDSIAVATARGASLGVQVEVYRWNDVLGMIDVMPAHPPAHRVTYIGDKDQFQLRLSFEKYPGEKGVPPPLLYRWDGHQLTRGDG